MVPVDERDAMSGYYGLALLEMADARFDGDHSRATTWLDGWMSALAMIAAGPELLPLFHGIEPWWLAARGLPLDVPDYGMHLLERLQESAEQLRQRREGGQEA